MTDHSKSGSPKLNITGTTPAGVTKKVAAHVGREVKKAFSLKGRDVRLKGLRFLPSTKVDLGDKFQLVANTVFEYRTPRAEGRSGVVDSIVTIGKEKGGQFVYSVTTPAVDALTAATGKGYEVSYFARKHGISRDQAKDLISRVGNDRVELNRAASELKK
jgi:hypothetical protein